jgi:hypothetical protein
MPLSFTIKGIEPNGLNAYPDAVRLLYWSWVTTLALKAKDRDLAAGLDAFGEPLRPISKETRKHRKSAMTPSGKGDPSAPPLSPGRKLSRVRSLLAGRALLDRSELWWRFDPFTHASFGRILTFQQEQGRDVFGLSDESTEEVRLAALRKWRQWLTTGQAVPLELEGRRVVAPMAATGTTGPLPAAGFEGHKPTKFAVYGIGGEPGTGAPVRGFSEAEFKAFYRQTMPANVQARPGTDYNRLLRHIWGAPPARGRGAAVPKPPPKPKPPIPKPEPKPVVPAIALTLERFAGAALQAARAVPEALRYAETKVWIIDAYAAFAAMHPEVSLDEFKRLLLEAHRARLLTLARFDVPGQLPPELRAKDEASAIRAGVAEFNQIRI